MARSRVREARSRGLVGLHQGVYLCRSVGELGVVHVGGLDQGGREVLDGVELETLEEVGVLVL